MSSIQLDISMAFMAKHNGDLLWARRVGDLIVDTVHNHIAHAESQLDQLTTVETWQRQRFFSISGYFGYLWVGVLRFEIFFYGHL